MGCAVELAAAAEITAAPSRTYRGPGARPLPSPAGRLACLSYRATGRAARANSFHRVRARGAGRCATAGTPAASAPATWARLSGRAWGRPAHEGAGGRHLDPPA